MNEDIEYDLKLDELERILGQNLKLSQHEVNGKTLFAKAYRKLLRLPEMSRLLHTALENNTLDLADELFDNLDFSYSLVQKQKLHIPATGGVIIIANHALGGLEALIMYRLLKNIRSDFQIFSDDPLVSVVSLSNNWQSNEKHIYRAKDYKMMVKALQEEKAIFFFPSEKISYKRKHGLVDGKWAKRVYWLINQSKALVLPIHFDTQNSFLYRQICKLRPRYERHGLLREAFNQKGKVVKLTIGAPIPTSAFENLKPKVALNLLRKHLALISQNRKGTFKTEKNVVHPVNRKLLRKEIHNALYLGQTEDGKLISLATYEDAPTLMEEIARLRELTFRKIGEGTGKKRDMDKYDKQYKHLVLWDDVELEVVGAYRLGIGSDIMQQKGPSGFYTHSLFTFSPQFELLLPRAIECGRSFVQEKYWNSLALDYLWHGIGAFIAHFPEHRYLFGPVSISQTYTKEARELLIYFYSHFFAGDGNRTVRSKNPIYLAESTIATMKKLFTHDKYKDAFKQLKKTMKLHGYSVPTLYKQYSELCEAGGVQFLDFGIDPDFSNCVDGFILVDVEKITEKKKARYVTSKIEEKILSA